MTNISSCRWNVLSATLAIFVPKMNASQEPKRQRPTTITILLPRRKFCSMVLRSKNPTLTRVYVLRGPSQLPEQVAEEAAQALEHFVNEASHIHAYPSTALEPAISSVAPDYPITYWSTTNNPQRHHEKLTLIREIVDSMPELDLIHALHEVFMTRCQGPLGNTVHTPTFMRQAEDFCGCLGFDSAEAQVLALSSTISMDTLASHLLAVRMPLHHEPSVCSRPFSTSLCSLSPFIPIHLYLDGLPQL